MIINSKFPHSESSDWISTKICLPRSKTIVKMLVNTNHPCLTNVYGYYYQPFGIWRYYDSPTTIFFKDVVAWTPLSEKEQKEINCSLKKEEELWHKCKEELPKNKETVYLKLEQIGDPDCPVVGKGYFLYEDQKWYLESGKLANMPVSAWRYEKDMI